MVYRANLIRMHSNWRYFGGINVELPPIKRCYIVYFKDHVKSTDISMHLDVRVFTER